jgi:DNA-binding protein
LGFAQLVSYSYKISISTEELEQREGGTRAVSAIEITLINPAVATKD